MYCTLARVREEKVVASTQTVDDKYILRLIKQFSSRIDSITNWTFEPRIEERRYDALSFDIDDDYHTLDLGFPLLETSQVFNGEGTELTLNTDYVYHPYNYPTGTTPYWQLRLLTTSNQSNWGSWSRYRTWDWQQSIRVLGTWGWRSLYPGEGWIDSLDKVTDASGISATTQTITVGGIAGADARFTTPRFSPGNLIRISTTSGGTTTREFCEIMAVDDSTTKTISVIRGVRGSTATTHAKDDPIAIWYPEPEIERACIRAVAYAQSRKGNFETTTVDAAGSIQYPVDLPAEVINMLKPFTRKQYKGI